MLSLKMLVVGRRLLRFDPELLHNWPPFLCVCLLHGGERFRSLLRARKNLASELGELRPHGRITGPTQIVGFNYYLSVRISGSAKPGYTSGDAIDEMETRLRRRAA
jgi:hypothetical protein